MLLCDNPGLTLSFFLLLASPIDEDEDSDEEDLVDEDEGA
jgi:hypothetical protein